MTVKEFAKNEGISESRVYQLKEAGRLDYSVIDGHLDIVGTHNRHRRGRKAGKMAQDHCQEKINDPVTIKTSKSESVPMAGANKLEVGKMLAGQPGDHVQVLPNK